MSSYPRTALLALNLIAVSACAHPAKESSQVSASDAQHDVVVPPTVLFSKTQLTLRSRGVRPHGTVEVPVDASGTPNVFGIRFLGSFDDLTRKDLADYISQLFFTPAKRNGIQTAGIYKMEFK